jgi:hypothetical protein
MTWLNEVRKFNKELILFKVKVAFKNAYDSVEYKYLKRRWVK